MGRRKTPIAEDGPAATFAAELRSVRIAAQRPTYRQMAALAGWSHNGLAEADRGRRMPTWDCTRAYLVGCGLTAAELDKWQDKWESTRRAITMRAELSKVPRRVEIPRQRRSLEEHPPAGGELMPEELRFASTGEQLVHACRVLLEVRSLSVDEVVEPANLARLPFAVPKLSRETLRDALQDPECPPVEVVVRLVAACGGTRQDIGAWFRVWHRIKETEDRARAQLSMVKAKVADEWRDGEAEQPADQRADDVSPSHEIDLVPVVSATEEGPDTGASAARDARRATVDASPVAPPAESSGGPVAKKYGGRHRRRGRLSARFFRLPPPPQQN